MRFWFWLREVAGWLLVLLSLLVFYLCYVFLNPFPPEKAPHAVVESGSLAVIGIFLFRGGINLLKTAMAARICLEARERVAPPRPTSVRRAKS